MHPILERLPALERLLVARGWPAMSAWWREQIWRFYISERRVFALRVGRRGGKSSTLCRVAVLEGLYGAHYIPPGDIGEVAIISVRRSDAMKRLATIKGLLDALGARYLPVPDGVQLVGRNVAFRVYTASIAGVSGFTCICAICDEVAKWRDADTGQNPATEVLASLRPTLVDQPNAKLFLSSSALGLLDAHAKAIEAGDTDMQLIASAATWEARPGLTKEETRKLEPDEAKWLREYASVPMEGTEASMLTPAVLDRCTRETAGDVARETGVSYFAAMDPAYTQNAWTLVIAGKRLVGSRIRRSIVCAREWRGTPDKPLEPEDVLRKVAAICASYGVQRVATDTYQISSLRFIAQRPEIALGVYVPDGSALDRLGRYESLVTRMSDGEVEIPPDRQIRADLLAIRQRLTANGFTIALPETADGRHADYAPAIVLAIDAARFDPILPAPVLTAAQESLARLKRDEDAMWAAQRQKWRPGQAPKVDQVPRMDR